jgi:hypothetical protein
MTAEHIKKERLVQKRAFGKEAISACFGGRASKGTIIYFNIDIDKKF